MKPEERANIMKTLKELTEKISQLKNEISNSNVSQSAGSVTQPKTKTDVRWFTDVEQNMSRVQLWELVCVHLVVYWLERHLQMLIRCVWGEGGLLNSYWLTVCPYFTVVICESWGCSEHFWVVILIWRHRRSCWMQSWTFTKSWPQERTLQTWRGDWVSYRLRWAAILSPTRPMLNTSLISRV